MPHQRNVPEIPGEKFHSHTAISPETSTEYETRVRGEMEAKSPPGIIERPIKNILRSWEELVWLQGHHSDQPNLLRPVGLLRNDLLT